MTTPAIEPRDASPRHGKPPVPGGRMTAVAGLLAVAASALSVPAAASGGTPHLSKPTGPHSIGTTSLHLTDTSRPDPWVPEEERELMVSLWYPAKPSGGPRAQYMTPTESELMLKHGGITGLPYDVLSTTRTNAVKDATPTGRTRGLPLVVLSPGYTKSRKTLTGLAEDLASHGYVVAAVDHTYENPATTFPDGRVATCASCEIPHDPTFWDKLEAGRAVDISFVLDELTGAQQKWARLIDPARIAMAGHSVGGASAMTAMLADSRLRAGIDVDGVTHTPIPDTGLSRPFLFMGRESAYTPGTPNAFSWERDWPHLTGWKRWLVVSGVTHASFTDVGLLGEQLGLDGGAELPAARATEITRRYTRAFFDLHLGNRPQPLLDTPSPRYPEVKFCAVETKTCE